MTALALLRDALGRIVAAREALESGDTSLVWTLLADLEADLAGALYAIAGRGVAA